MSSGSWRDNGGLPDHGPRRRNLPFTYASRRNTRPNPPFPCNDVHFAYHSFEVDPDRVAPFLPAGMRLTPDHLAYTAMCAIGESWSLGPFSYVMGGVVVEGHDSPDGTEGAFVLFAYHSPSVSQVFRDHYDASSMVGDCRVWNDDGLWWSTVSPPGQSPHLRVAVRPESAPTIIDGIDLYMSRNAQGHVLEWTAAYNGAAETGDIISFDIAADAPPAMQAMRPTMLHWGQRNRDFQVSFSAPRQTRLPTDEAGWAAERAFLSLLGEHPSAALVVGADCQVRHMNAVARSLIGPTVSRTDGQLRGADVASHHVLESAVLAALSRLGGRMPFRLVLRGMEPLIAQAFPVDPQVFGLGSVLLLLTDPRAPISRNPHPGLRLLGLTEAEARIAGSVGGGNTPRIAAEKLGLTENTVRKTLKSVYGKLGVRRQAELATLVSRLAST